MTATKVIGESVKQTNRTFIKSYVEDYAKAITENYRRYHLNTLNGNLHGNYPEYAREQLDAIENGTANLMKFKVYTGKRYYKIVQQEFQTWEVVEIMENMLMVQFIALLIKKQVMYINQQVGQHQQSISDFLFRM